MTALPVPLAKLGVSQAALLVAVQATCADKVIVTLKTLAAGPTIVEAAESVAMAPAWVTVICLP